MLWSKEHLPWGSVLRQPWIGSMNDATNSRIGTRAAQMQATQRCGMQFQVTSPRQGTASHDLMPQPRRRMVQHGICLDSKAMYIDAWHALTQMMPRQHKWNLQFHWQLQATSHSHTEHQANNLLRNLQCN